MKGKLNVDVPTSINDLQSMMKDFRLKDQIYKLLFRGKGLEFEGFRDYTPDDDASSIDWKTSSRVQKPLVKQYKEERDLNIMFIVDVGDNMVFGSTEKLKCEYVTEIIAALGHLIVLSNDKVGFFLFSNVISNYVECKTGQNHFHFFVDVLSDGANYGGKTNLNQALDFAMDYFDNSIASVFIISDFLSVNSDTEKKLSLLSNQFETVLIQVKDPLDITLPDVEGEVVLEDAETSEQIIINPKVAKKTYEQYALEQDNKVQELFEKTKADTLSLVTSIPFAEPLALFLMQRAQKNI
ncbi:MAG: DUF58 domain-containing protein [Nanoarchaeota archaeon]|nr:DUF58 domain-containing protein [Nanoarchaeota archaeon]MBU1027877.1 DUF58 domain-containing protein [Nanoarchaeota archaeon]